MWASFATKAQKQFYMKFVCKFVFDFRFQKANPISIYNLRIGLLESVNHRKTCSKIHVSLLLWPKLPTYFDDVTTIENNRQVWVNVDARLVAIFCIMKALKISSYLIIDHCNIMSIMGLYAYPTNGWTNSMYYIMHNFYWPKQKRAYGFY